MLLFAQSFLETIKISRKTNPLIAQVSPVTVSHNSMFKDWVWSSLVGTQAVSCTGDAGKAGTL